MFHWLSKPATSQLLKAKKNSNTNTYESGREESTFKYESGFSNASGAVKNEGLRDTMMLNMIVENGL